MGILAECQYRQHNKLCAHIRAHTVLCQDYAFCVFLCRFQCIFVCTFLCARAWVCVQRCCFCIAASICHVSHRAVFEPLTTTTTITVPISHYHRFMHSLATNMNPNNSSLVSLSEKNNDQNSKNASQFMLKVSCNAVANCSTTPKRDNAFEMLFYYYRRYWLLLCFCFWFVSGCCTLSSANRILWAIVSWNWKHIGKVEDVNWLQWQNL